MKTISLTSKNQITLPVSIVQRAGLHKGTRFAPRIEGGSIVLEPQQDIDTVVADVQSKLRPLIKKPLSDKELKESLRNWS